MHGKKTSLLVWSSLCFLTIHLAEFAHMTKNCHMNIYVVKTTNYLHCNKLPDQRKIEQRGLCK